MFTNEICPECRVPRYITREHLWLDSGVIVQKGNPSHRLTIIDTLNLDPLYQDISDLIGVPIERIVTETARRTTRAYMDKMLAPEMKEAACNSQEGLMGLVEVSFQIGRLLGCGNPRLKELRVDGSADDHVTIEVIEPYPAPLYFGNFAGTAEVVLGQESGVTYRETSASIFEATVFRSEHPEEVRERLVARPYTYEAGSVEMEKCGTCGGPAGLSDYIWDIESGIIKTRASGQRVAMLGPEMLDPIFTELENELGEAIPHLVIEAQRRYIRSRTFVLEGLDREESARIELALRGIGDLREFELSGRSLRIRLENAGLHLLMIGQMQGLFELYSQADSRVLWELSDNSTLDIEIEAI